MTKIMGVEAIKIYSGGKIISIQANCVALYIDYDEAVFLLCIIAALDYLNFPRVRLH